MLKSKRWRFSWIRVYCWPFSNLGLVHTYQFPGVWHETQSKIFIRSHETLSSVIHLTFARLESLYFTLGAFRAATWVNFCLHAGILHLGVHLTCSAFIHWQVKRILFLHLSSKFHAMPSLNPPLSSCDPYKERWSVVEHNAKSLAQALFLHTPLFFSFLDSSSRTCISIYCLISQVRSRLIFHFIDHIPTQSPIHQTSFRESLDGATSFAYCAHTHSHRPTYLRGVHGCDRCATTLRWAFQHFWSDQRRAHSSPLSQYLENKYNTPDVRALMCKNLNHLKYIKYLKWTKWFHRGSLGKYFHFDRTDVWEGNTTGRHHNVACVTINYIYSCQAKPKAWK